MSHVSALRGRFHSCCPPKNYPHKIGVWNLFDFGVQRYKECLAYGFGTPESLGRILLMGFEQFDADNGQLLSSNTRERMRKQDLVDIAK